MKCECGRTYGLSKHIQTERGWITLKEPMCWGCREKILKQTKEAAYGTDCRNGACDT